MNDITQHDTRIKNRWLLRVILQPRMIPAIVFGVLFLLFSNALEYGLILLLPLSLFLYLYISTKFFNIQFGSDTVSVQQGIFSRRSTNIPYNKIENVVVERDIFDRMFGTSRIVIDNFGVGKAETAFGIPLKGFGGYPGSKNYSIIAPGVHGERLFLPGLLPASAEKIKER